MFDTEISLRFVRHLVNGTKTNQFSFSTILLFFIIIDEIIQYSDYYKTCDISKKKQYTYNEIKISIFIHKKTHTGSIELVFVQCRREPTPAQCSAYLANT